MSCYLFTYDGSCIPIIGSRVNLPVPAHSYLLAIYQNINLWSYAQKYARRKYIWRSIEESKVPEKILAMALLL